jgi:hypothetical protein
MRLVSLLVLLMILDGCGAGMEGDSLKAQNEKIAGPDRPVASKSVVEPPRGPKPRPEFPEDCPLVVGFSSYGAGIDREAYRAVGNLLESDPAVLSVDRHPWGREGEVAICVTPRSTADAERLFHRIKAIFPREPRGPLGVSTRSGLTHHVNWNR